MKPLQEDFLIMTRELFLRGIRQSQAGTYSFNQVSRSQLPQRGHRPGPSSFVEEDGYKYFSERFDKVLLISEKKFTSFAYTKIMSKCPSEKSLVVTKIR